MHTNQSTLMITVIVTLLSVIGVALPYPVLTPLFLEHQSPMADFGGLPAPLLLGGVLAIYPLFVFIGGQYIGSWSDIHGRRPLLLHTTAGAIVGYLLSAYALYSDNYLLLLASRAVTGLCEGNVAVARAIVTDIATPEQKTQSFARISAAAYAGYLFGPLLGGFLAQWHAGFVFIGGAVLMVLAWLAIAAKLPETRQPTEAGDGGGGNAFQLLGDLRVRQLWSGYLLVTLGINAFYQFYPFYLVEKWHFDAQEIATATALLTISMIFFSLVLIKKVEGWLGQAQSICIASLVLAGLMVAMPLPDDAWSVMVMFPLFGLAIGAVNGYFTVYISNECAEAPQGQLMGLLSSTFFITSVSITLVGSIIASESSRFTLWLGGISLVLGILLFSHYLLQKQRRASLADSAA